MFTRLPLIPQQEVPAHILCIIVMHSGDGADPLQCWAHLLFNLSKGVLNTSVTSWNGSERAQDKPHQKTSSQGLP